MYYETDGVTFYKKLCNYYLIKSQNLYFQDKFFIYNFLNHCPEAPVSKTQYINNLLECVHYI